MSDDIVERLKVQAMSRVFPSKQLSDGTMIWHPMMLEAADEITRLREEVGRLTMALAEAQMRAERDYLRFVEADREEFTLLREQIRLLTEEMPAGDARRKLAEQHAEIERLRRLAAG